MSDPTMNIADRERLASVIAGAGLFLVATRQRRGPALATAAVATGLLARGVSGHCAVYRAAHIDTRDTDTRRLLGGSGGIHVCERVVIHQPLDAIYSFWRDLANLPRFFRHLRAVTPHDERRSRWVAAGPAGSSVEWEAEIVNDVPNQVIGWRSLGEADIVSAGSVNFDEAMGGRGTVVTVKLQYEPPAGRVGAWAAWLLGADPASQIRDDLRSLKQQLEAGETPTVTGQPRGGELCGSTGRAGRS